MGKTGNAIKMLSILGTGNCYSVPELARLLDTNKRNIFVYRDEIEMSGYDIKGVPGPNGGYRLNTRKAFPSISLTPSELKAMHDAYNMLYGNKAFIKQDDLTTAFGKLFSSIKDNNDEEELISLYSGNADAMSKEDIEKRYDFIMKAMKNRQEVELVYNFVTLEKQTIIFHVYDMYLYNGAWYFTGYNQTAKELYKYLKLTRIESFSFTGKTFEIWEGYKNFEKYVDKKIGKLPLEVTFIAKGFLVKLLKERPIGENQIIEEEYDDGSIKVTTTFKDEENAVRYLSGCRDKVKVVSPKAVIEKLLDYSKYLIETYK